MHLKKLRMKRKFKAVFQRFSLDYENNAEISRATYLRMQILNFTF